MPQTFTGDSPLLWACFKGQAEVAAALLGGGADANALCALGNRVGAAFTGSLQGLRVCCF